MENQSTKELRGEEVERELKHRERNYDEDLTCRPRAEMNAPPPEELPPNSRALPPTSPPAHSSRFILPLSRPRLSLRVPALALSSLQSARSLSVRTCSVVAGAQHCIAHVSLDPQTSETAKVRSAD